VTQLQIICKWENEILAESSREDSGVNRFCFVVTPLSAQQFSKDEARRETLQRWRALPAQSRRNVEDAAILADSLVRAMQFRTMADPKRLIFAWLVRELDGLPPWGNIRPQPGPTSAQ